MKKQFYILAMVALMTTTVAANAQNGSKKVVKAFEKSKKEYLDLTSACRACEQAVENDSINGTHYKNLKKQIQVLSDSLKNTNNKYSAALIILQREAERNPYNTKAERSAYKKRKQDLEKSRQAEIDEVYAAMGEAYKNLATHQKTYYAEIVDRNVAKSMK